MVEEIFGGLLNPGEKTSPGPSMSISREDKGILDGSDELVVSPLNRSRMNLSSLGPWGMGKSAVVSVMLHVLVVALLVVCFAGSTKKPLEMITVFLTDTSSPGEKESSLKAMAPVAAKRAAPSTRADLKTHPVLAIPEVTRPLELRTESHTPASGVVPAESSTLSVLPAELPVTSSPGGTAEGRGSQEGAVGTGVAPTGADTNGTGSGIGHEGSDATDGGKNQYLAHNYGYIRDMIVKNLKYPYDARRMGWKGSVTVAFVILENGGVEAVRVTKSSGYDLLDESVLKTISALQPYPKPPKRAELVLPIAFRLE